MGFHINVHTKDNDPKTWMECYKFLDKRFYQWVSEAQHHGDESCILKTGQYFQLDLTPLTKLVYTAFDEVDDQVIEANIQEIKSLHGLVYQLKECLEEEPNCLHHIEYAIDPPLNRTKMEWVKNKLKGISLIMQKNNAGPWQWYYESGELVLHLQLLLDTFNCFKKKGYNQVFLGAG